MIALPVGGESDVVTGDHLWSIPVPGEKVRDSHITIVNFGDDMSQSDIAIAMVETFRVVSKMPPFKVYIDTLTSFPKGDKGYPIIVEVDSAGVHELHDKLLTRFDNAGIEYSRKFPKFKPHVTLSYSDTPVQETGIKTCSWTARTVGFYYGDEAGTDKTIEYNLVG